MRKLILIDGNALVHRAFHALPPTLTSPKGVLTNAVYGFTSVLIKMIKELKPDYIAASFDLAAPTFRHEEFAEYKSHRIKAPDELYAQIPMVKDILIANPFVDKCLDYHPMMENLTWLEGNSSHNGYFNVAYLPHALTQRYIAYYHGGEDKLDLNLK